MIRDLAYLAIRVMSIYLFFKGIRNLFDVIFIGSPAFSGMLVPNQLVSELTLMLSVPAILFILSSIVLWFLAPKLSTLLIPKRSSEMDHSIRLAELEGFVMSVVGLLLCIQSFSALIPSVVNYMRLYFNDMLLGQLNFITSFLEQGLRLLAGILLIWKAEGLALLLRKIRSLGLKSPKKEMEDE